MAKTVAELVARGLEGFVYDLHDVPSITNGVCSPALDYSWEHPYMWSRQSGLIGGPR